MGGIACVLLATVPGQIEWVEGAAPRLAPHDIHIEMPSDSLFGSLPSNRRLTLSVSVPQQPSPHGEPDVAIFQSPAAAPFIAPLEIDPDRHRQVATVDLGHLSSTLGDPPKATPLEIVIARRQGLHWEELVRRRVVVTIAIPGYTDRSTAAAVRNLSAHLSDASRQASDHHEVALLDGPLEEQDLLGSRRPFSEDGYWKMLQGLIRQRVQRDTPVRSGNVPGKMPSIGFRLYANGEAQLIEVERSSGDHNLDQATLLAVVNAHPFPPFPPGSRTSHVDVHVDLASSFP